MNDYVLEGQIVFCGSAERPGGIVSRKVHTQEEVENDLEKILPIYIMVDSSWSMSPSQNDAISTANTLIPTIIDTCRANPLADVSARFSVISFNDSAELIAPLMRGSNLAHHIFTPQYTTSFTDAFRLLREALDSDINALLANGYLVYRPAVFLITDGMPTCDAAEREVAFSKLTDRKYNWRPNISVFGLGNEITDKAILSYATGQGRAMTTVGGGHASQALASYIDALMQSIVSSLAESDMDSAEHGSASQPIEGGFTWNEDALANEDYLRTFDSPR